MKVKLKTVFNEKTLNLLNEKKVKKTMFNEKTIILLNEKKVRDLLMILREKEECEIEVDIGNGKLSYIIYKEKEEFFFTKIVHTSVVFNAMTASFVI